MRNSLPIVFSNPNESYSIALLIKGRSGGASTKHLYRSGASSTDDHMMWLASGTTPNARHDSNTGTVTITSNVSITNDTAWHTIVTTWRKNRLELYVDGISRANSTAANTDTSDAFGIYRWGWGFSTNQDFNGDIALILCCGACWTGHMVRRWHADPFGFLRPWTSAALMEALHPPCPPRLTPAWSPSSWGSVSASCGVIGWSARHDGACGGYDWRLYGLEASNLHLMSIGRDRERDLRMVVFLT